MQYPGMLRWMEPTTRVHDRACNEHALGKSWKVIIMTLPMIQFTTSSPFSMPNSLRAKEMTISFYASEGFKECPHDVALFQIPVL